MTERGLPSVDGASACPFVAFEDDREARATSPDHRHRCFAEAPPVPRALAHQEAYCLSSAFPVCPTFQDWARREAAHARGADDRPAAAAASASASASAAGIAAQGGRPDADDSDRPQPPGPSIEDAEPHRNPPRDWAAPPPWASGPMGVNAAGKTGRGADVASAPDFLAARSTEGAGLAGSAADRLAGGPPLPPGVGSAGSVGSGTRAAAGSVPRAAAGSVPRAAAGSVPRAAAGSVPPAVVGGTARIAVGSLGGAHADASPVADDELVGLVHGRGTGAVSGEPARPSAPPAPKPGPPQTVNPARPSGDTVTGPSWERMKRYEAYPTIKTRAGLPNLPALPRIVVLAAALGVAALALFFLPALLGVGGGGPTATASPTASRPAATASSSPTALPAPTPHVYVIAAGDTLSRVAKKFGLTVEQLLAANKDTIKNPDKIAIGDRINIPIPPQDQFTNPSAEPSAQSPAP